MSDRRPIAELVAQLLATPKELVGDPSPKAANRDDQVRWAWPVLVNGEADQTYVSATLYPNDIDPRFSISLIFGTHNIWRLDYELGRIETNPFLPGHEFSGKVIYGPHCHQWDENRRFATKSTIPDPLPFRVPLNIPLTGTRVQQWENSFRYFAGQTRIGQPHVVPEWPTRGRFL